MRKHWSDVLFCAHCGRQFRSMVAEARHRHNFPLLCEPLRSYTTRGVEFQVKSHGVDKGWSFEIPSLGVVSTEVIKSQGKGFYPNPASARTQADTWIRRVTPR